MCLCSDGADRVCVPDDQVSIGANSDPTLTWVQVQDLSCIGAGNRHKHVLIHLTCSLEKKTSQVDLSERIIGYLSERIIGY